MLPIHSTVPLMVVTVVSRLTSFVTLAWKTVIIRKDHVIARYGIRF